jgi:hypothetical protein
MPERLGELFYWAGCGLAALLGLLCLFTTLVDRSLATLVDRPADALMCAVTFGFPAIGAWLVGKAAFHILAGR